MLIIPQFLEVIGCKSFSISVPEVMVTKILDRISPKKGSNDESQDAGEEKSEENLIVLVLCRRV